MSPNVEGSPCKQALYAFIEDQIAIEMNGHSFSIDAIRTIVMSKLLPEALVFWNCMERSICMSCGDEHADCLS
jgi:hypothetical protein